MVPTEKRAICRACPSYWNVTSCIGLLGLHCGVLSLVSATRLALGGDGVSGLEALSPIGQSQGRQSRVGGGTRLPRAGDPQGRARDGDQAFARRSEASFTCVLNIRAQDPRPGSLGIQDPTGAAHGYGR